MGATKCVAEKVIQALSQRGDTRFLAVRFGNVLGSRGSLIPLIQDQIRRGGPVTLTHPEMRRYFMSPAEAVLLVLQASTMEIRTGIFLLDMGADQNRRSGGRTHSAVRFGARPGCPIVFTGVRAGEKMEEELSGHDETLKGTPFDRIFEVRSNGITNESILRLRCKR